MRQDGDPTPQQDETIIEAAPYWRLGSWILVGACVLQAGNCLQAFFTPNTMVSPGIQILGTVALAIPLLMVADMLGTTYRVSDTHIQRLGFFGTTKKLAWQDITEITLKEAWRGGREIEIRAKHHRIAFEAGAFWWRQGFFKTAETIVALAKKREIPVKVTWKGIHRPERCVEDWFDLGRKGVFAWSKPQLPPKESEPYDD